MKNCSAKFHKNPAEDLVADTKLRTNGHDLHVWGFSIQRLLKTNKKLTISFITCVCPPIWNNSARAKCMVVSGTKATVAVVVAVAVIFNFSTMVAMFTKAAIDFMVTAVMLVITVIKVSMVTFVIVITKVTIPRS